MQEDARQPQKHDIRDNDMTILEQGSRYGWEQGEAVRAIGAVAGGTSRITVTAEAMRDRAGATSDVEGRVPVMSMAGRGCTG